MTSFIPLSHLDESYTPSIPFLVALSRASAAHAGQIRKLTKQPYIIHPLNVCNTLISLGFTSDEYLVTAILHDILEDSDYHIRDIEIEFGREIASLVFAVTNPLHRLSVKKLKAAHIHGQLLANADLVAVNIKLADMLDNLLDFKKQGSQRLVSYQEEKSILFQNLMHGDPTLVSMVEEALNE